MDVWVVDVPGRVDGLYVFAAREDAIRFATAAGAHVTTGYPVNDRAGTDTLIAVEREGND